MRRCTLAAVVATLIATMCASVGPLAAQTTESDGVTSGSPAVVTVTSPTTSVFTADARRMFAASGSDDLLSVVVKLSEQIDLSALLADSEVVSADVVEALQDHAARDQALLRLLAPLWERGASVESFTPFWITNGFSITATPAVIASISNFVDVVEIDIEHTYLSAAVPPTGPPTANIDAVGAPAAWSRGFTGAGTVVAVLDTGVDMIGIPGVFPSEVAGTYRGGTNSWFDPYTVTTEPYDLEGHGTAVASIITGADQSGSAVGVAPGAQWIAAKIFDDSGSATTTAIRSALEWVLDPDGDPTTDDGADVVNASWTGAAPGCDSEFAPDIAALRAAGVIPVFAAGNLGPLPGSSPSPSNLPGVLAVGAVQADDTIVSESSRGPTECGGATRTYPHLVAPGDGITAQTVQGQFVPHTGTSFAAPHVAGAVALLVEANGGRDDAAIEAAIVGSTIDLGDPGADDTFGAGVLDIGAALDLLVGVAPTAGSVTGLVFEDLNGNGTYDDGEIPTGSAQLALMDAGDDATFGTADDVILAETVTDPDGTYVFSGVAVGGAHVVVSPTSLPGSAQLTTPGVQDVTVVEGEATTANFGWRPPDPGALTVDIYDDANADAIHQDSELAIEGVTIRVTSAGTDGLWGTSDDVGPLAATSDATGAAVVSDLSPGPARIAVDTETLPAGGYVSSVSSIEVIVVSAGIVNIGIGVHTPESTEPIIFVSWKRAGRTNDSTLGFRDEDILAWTGARYEMLFDGSDVGLGGVDVDAFHVVDDSTILLSVDRAISLPELGQIEDHDVLQFDATELGTSTRGTFSIYLDGSDLGLEGPGSDIDAIAMGDGELLVSVRGNITVGGIGLVRDEDLLRVELEEVGPQSIGSISVWFDGSGSGLTTRSGDIDAAAVRGTDGELMISTLGEIRAPGLVATDTDVLACTDLEACIWTVRFPHSSFGLGLDIDGIALPEGES